MRTFFLIAILLIAASVQAADEWRDFDAWTDTVYIDQDSVFPMYYQYNIPSPGGDSTLFIVNEDIHCDSSFFRLDWVYNNPTRMWKIQGNNHTITFDSSGNGDTYGLWVNNSHCGIIENLTIVQALVADSGIYGNNAGSDAVGILVWTNDSLWFDNVNSHVRGHSSQTFNAAAVINTNIMCEIDGGNYTSWSKSFESRHGADGATMAVKGSKTPPIGGYNWFIHGITLDSAVYAGIQAGTADGVVWVDTNNVTIDAFNDKITQRILRFTPVAVNDTEYRDSISYGADTCVAVYVSDADATVPEITAGMVSSYASCSSILTAADSTDSYYITSVAYEAGLAIVNKNATTDTSKIDNGGGWSWANAHAISDLNGFGAGSHMNNNTIRSGTNHYGGRGMYFEKIHGSAESPIEIAHNDIQITSGVTDTVTNDGTDAPDSRGVRFRYGTSYVNFHHNTIINSADDSATTPQVSVAAHGIWFTGTDTSTNIHVYNNHIETMWAGPDTNVVTDVQCIIWEGQGPNNSNLFYDNYFKTNTRAMWVGFSNGGTDEFTSLRDTFDVDSLYADGYGWTGVITVGAYLYESMDNIFIDAIFLAEDSISRGTVNAASDQSISQKRSVIFEVTDGVDPIEGATVRAWSNFDDSTAAGEARVDKTTDVSGYVNDTLPYQYTRWDGGAAQEDSLYIDYNGWAAFGTDTAYFDELTFTHSTEDVGGYVSIPLELTESSGVNRILMQNSVRLLQGVNLVR